MTAEAGHELHDGARSRIGLSSYAFFWQVSDRVADRWLSMRHSPRPQPSAWTSSRSATTPRWKP